jgi:large repetitive protein
VAAASERASTRARVREANAADASRSEAGAVRRLKLALAVVGMLAAIVVTGGSAADFEVDNGPCPETPGEPALLRCPTAYVGVPYELEIESEEGSGCSPNYDYFVIVNSSLPPGLTMSRDGVISGTPTTTGLTRFWIFNHDLSRDQGGPDWCDRDDTSEREFSIFVDPGLSIENQSVKPASVGQPYTDTLTARRVDTLNPVTGPDVQASWSVQSGLLPPGITLSNEGVLAGTPTSEGSYQFVVRAQNGSPFDTETYTLAVRQAVTLTSPFVSTVRPGAEVGLRFSATAKAMGGTGTYVWSLASGALPSGLALAPASGVISGVPQTAGNFSFGLSATDAEGRIGTTNGALNVAPRLTVKTLRLKAARVGHPYLARLATAGGVRPVKWKVLKGSLPKGIRLNRALGSLVGTPTKAGRHGVTFQAKDGLKGVAKTTLRIVVA